MKNPIIGNEYDWGSIKFVIQDDFSYVNVNGVNLPTRALQDLLKVMEEEMEDNKEKYNSRDMNWGCTTRSCPIGTL